jgi:hypothetical protein
MLSHPSLQLDRGSILDQFLVDELAARAHTIYHPAAALGTILEAVADQVPARAFYHSGGDRPAGCECLVVAQVLLAAGQVARACLHAGPLASGQPALAGAG